MNAARACRCAWLAAAVLLSGSPAFAARCGEHACDHSKVPGVVIAHSPAASKRYIGSPSIAILPDGSYAASHDFFGPNAEQHTNPTSVVFASKDRGKTWRKIADITPMFWAKLFVHEGSLYILGTRHMHGDLLIRRSEDNGQTWTEPATPATGLLRTGRYHCAPCPRLVGNGRIWRSLETPTQGNRGGYDALVISAPVHADLLNAENWLVSERLIRPQELNWREGSLVPAPDGNIVSILRANLIAGERVGVGTESAAADKASIVSVRPDGRALRYDPKRDLIDMPGGGAKFTVRYDKQTARYWAIVNKQTNPKAYRNNLALISSANLRHWKVESPLLYHPNAEKYAWQYVDWLFDGADIVFVSRTAFDDGLGGARSAHNANFMTFHKIEEFRNRAPGPLRPH